MVFFYKIVYNFLLNKLSTILTLDSESRFNFTLVIVNKERDDSAIWCIRQTAARLSAPPPTPRADTL
ncbi:unnamed protein product, partial [Trichogramma brassicae]